MIHHFVGRCLKRSADRERGVDSAELVQANRARLHLVDQIRPSDNFSHPTTLSCRMSAGRRLPALHPDALAHARERLLMLAGGDDQEVRDVPQGFGAIGRTGCPDEAGIESGLCDLGYRAAVVYHGIQIGRDWSVKVGGMSPWHRVLSEVVDDFDAVIGAPVLADALEARMIDGEDQLTPRPKSTDSGLQRPLPSRDRKEHHVGDHSVELCGQVDRGEVRLYQMDSLPELRLTLAEYWNSDSAGSTETTRAPLSASIRLK
jgi:hypothetical protein